jgi:peptide/nickel transport system substrate-binding protein
VTFTLKTPLSNFLDLFLLVPLIDEKAYSGLASGTMVIGTGPFTWDSWTPATQLQLSRNKDYWRPGEPSLDSVTLKVYSQSQALLAALQSAEIDMSYMMLARDAATFAGKPWRRNTRPPGKSAARPGPSPASAGRAAA